jgi:hypothetical protein
VGTVFVALGGGTAFVVAMAAGVLVWLLLGGFALGGAGVREGDAAA